MRAPRPTSATRRRRRRKGQRESPARIGWDELPSLGPGRQAAPTPAVNVFVTGGSRGIGRAIALRFARGGADRIAIGYLRNDRAAEADRRRVARTRRRGRPRARQRHVGSRARRGRSARTARRARPQRRDRGDPARARDRGQALGLDDERERPRPAPARPGRGAADAGRLVDRCDLVPRRTARARELRSDRHVQGSARVARSLSRRRARARGSG